MDKQESKVWPCKHCGRVFASAGEWWSHNCDDEDAQPVTVTPAHRNTIAIVGPMTPAQRDTVAMLYNAPRTQVETDGDQLWA